MNAETIRQCGAALKAPGVTAAEGSAAIRRGGTEAFSARPKVRAAGSEKYR